MSFESFETDPVTTDFDVATAFASLIGDWTGTETIHKSKFCPQQMTSAGQTSFRPGLGGAVLISDHSQSMGGQVIYAQHAVFSRAKDGSLQLFSFDDPSVGPDDFRGSLRGQVMRLEASNAGGRWRFSLDFTGADASGGSYATRSEFWHDGAWAINTEATYTRAG